MTPALTPPRRAAGLVLLLAGVALWLYWFANPLAAGYFLALGPFGLVGLLALIAVAAVAVVVPRVAAGVATAAARLTAGGRRRPIVAAVAAAVVTFGYLSVSAQDPGRTRRPYVHDEFSYLIQAHQFAHLHGWMPPHPLGLAFDSFQLFARPVYASAYFPGTAVLFVPGVWLHVPPYLTALTIAAAVAGLVFGLTLHLMSGPAAVAAVLLLWSDGSYRALSTMTMAQMPVLLYGLTATAAYFAWRANGRRRWAAVVGGALGLAAVTRPVDTLAFAIPIGVAVVVALRRRPGRLLATVAVMSVAAAPMLAAQLVLDRGITGRWTETPFRLYADRDYPGTAYGFHRFDPAARPESPLPQKQSLFDYYRPAAADHTLASTVDNLFHAHGSPGLSPARLQLTLVQSFQSPRPFGTLLPLVPLSLLGLTRPRAVVVAALPLFVALYMGYVFFFMHYALAAAAAVIVASLIGAEQLPWVLLPERWAARAAPVVMAAVAVVAVGGLPQADFSVAADVLFPAPFLANLDRQLAAVTAPAVVLFAYSPDRDVHEEPVYNADVAWPDDAPVVRAHDLGPAADGALFRYYAAHGPPRTAYRYDEQTKTLTRLGSVDVLAAR